MKYSRIAAIIALAASTAACATTQKIGSGVVTIVKAPIDIADAALTGTERVLSVADKAVSIAAKTRSVVSGVPGADPLASLKTIKAQTSAVRWALGGLEKTQRAATTVSRVSNARNYVSAPSQTAYQTQAAAPYVPIQRAYTPALNHYVKSRAPQPTAQYAEHTQYASQASSAARSYTPPQPAPSYIPTAPAPSYAPAPTPASYTPAPPAPSYAPAPPAPSYAPTPPAPSYAPTQPAPSYTPTTTASTYAPNSAASHSQPQANTGQTYSSSTYSSRPSMTYSSSGSRVKSASITH